VSQGNAQPTVLLTGATGQVGVFILPRLLAAGYPVVACSRRISRTTAGQAVSAAGGVRWFHPTVAPVSEALPGTRGSPGFLQDVEIIISCGPVELAARLAPGCSRLRAVICISSSSVLTKLQSEDARERSLITGIRESEDALRDYCGARGARLVLLRPTLIYGCGLDQNVSRLARLIRRFHFMPVAGRAAGRRQPLHAADLAGLVLTILAAGDGPDIESVVGGGSVITYRELVERVFTGLGLSPRIMQLPPGLLAAIARMISWLPLARGLNAEFVLRQNRDLVFDDTPLRKRFGFNPRPFAPGPRDFEVPASAVNLLPP